MFNVAAVKKENKIRHNARLLCFNVLKNLVFATCFEVRQNKQSLFVKNSVKFRQIGSIYDILEMSMFGRKIYVLFYFFDVIFIWLQ